MSLKSAGGTSRNLEMAHTRRLMVAPSRIALVALARLNRKALLRLLDVVVGEASMRTGSAPP